MTDAGTLAAFAHADALMALKPGALVRMKEDADLAWRPRESGWDTMLVHAGEMLRVEMAGSAHFQAVSVYSARPGGGIERLHIWPSQFGLVEIVTTGLRPTMPFYLSD